MLAVAPVGAVGEGVATNTSPGFSGVWTSGPSTADAVQVTDLRAAWSRVMVIWETVQPTSAPAYNWTGIDQVVVNASGGGSRNVLLMVRNNPGWASPHRCQVVTDPERQLLAAFATAIVSRYKTTIPDGPLAGQTANVKFWQFYNEAQNTSEVFDTQHDLGGCFGTLNASGTPTQEGRDNYAALLETVGPAVHATDQTASVVMSPEVSGSYTDDPRCQPGWDCIFDRGFLQGVFTKLRTDARLADVDVVSVHYFSSQAPDFSHLGADLIGRVGSLRQAMLNAQLTPGELKPILVDEGSYTGGPSGATSSASTTDPFNIAQRNYVVQVLARAASLNLAGYLWFWSRDQGSGLGSDVPYGLTELTGAPKPSYNAFRYFTSLIDATNRFVRTLALPTQLEGYEFNTIDGRTLQIVWNQTDTAQVAYVVPGTIASVTDPVGNTASTNGNAVMIGSDPRFIFYTPFTQLGVAPAGSGTGTVTSSPVGISCGSVCSGGYAPGTSVILTATPDPGTVFSGWSGDCSGSGTCSVTLDAARSVTATFVAASLTLSVARSGSGTGTVTSVPAGISCPPTCSSSYPAGTPVTLTATPNAGNEFDGWNGACTGPGACSVTMNAAQSLTGVFRSTQTCFPRPRIIVSAVPAIPGQLRVTVTETGQSVALQSLQFGSPGGNPSVPANALIDVGTVVGGTGGFTVALPGGSTQVAFVIRRAIQGVATTVPLLVTDSCGTWSTIVGGGPTAF
jgi:hypothetical protein